MTTRTQTTLSWLIVIAAILARAVILREKIPAPVSRWKSDTVYIWHGEPTRDASQCSDCKVPNRRR